MARTFNITDGTTTVNLLDTAGFQATSLGAKTLSVDANVPAGHLHYVETYQMILYSTDQDAAADQLQTLFALLRKAHLYHTTSWQNVPVYLTAQTDRETNARYAMVFGVPSIGMGDVFDIPFATGDLLEGLSITLLRGIWRSGAPGATPAAATLSKTDASADTVKAVVANQYTSAGFAFLGRAESPTSDGVLYGTDTPSLAAWYVDTDTAASTDARGKLINFTSTDPSVTAVVDLATAGAFVAGSWMAQHFDGSAWKETGSSNFTWYAENANSTDTFDDVFLQTTDILVMSWNAPSSDTGTFDHSDGSGVVYNVAILASTDTFVTTQPVQSSDEIYLQNKPYIELSSDILKGDIPPMVELRMFGMYGQTDTDAAFGATSKIILGAKTNPGSFASHLNCGGGGLPSTDWAVAYDTDTTAVADTRSSGGFHAACTFAATPQITRVALTGDNLMDSYRGEYKAFLRVEQVSGTDGDVSVALQIKLGSTDPASPARLGELMSLSTHDNGWEIVDLGQFSIPFVETADTDYLDGDIIFEIQAVQNTAGATIKFADLILMPVDEWAMVLDDPISDNNTGSSALRGNRRLDLDSGVLGHRASLNLKSGTSYLSGENWFYGGRPFAVEPAQLTRIYFLMGHYHANLGWGNEPIMSTIAQALVVEVRAQALYLSMRGAD
jgi:hypothetical protein